MDSKTDLSVNDWQRYANDILLEINTLANALRIEQAGFIGFVSMATVYHVKEGLLNVYLSIDTEGSVNASAILHHFNGTTKEMGSTKIERPAIAA